MRQGGDDIASGGVGIRPEEQVPGTERQARPVGQRITHGKVLADPGVIHRKFGDIGPDRRIPVNEPPVDEDGKRGRGEGFRDRRDGQEHILRKRCVRAFIGFAVSGLKDDLAIDSDGCRHAGGIEGFHRAQGLGLKIGQGVFRFS